MKLNRLAILLSILFLSGCTLTGNNSHSESEDTQDESTTSEKSSEDKTSEESLVEKELLKDAIKIIGNREREILYLRYYLGKTQMEISSEIGISQAQVSRLEKTALKQMKDYSM